MKLFTEEGVEVVPGSGEIGMVAVPGSIPEGYFHDEEKTARTFREFGGVRYSIPGDWGTIGEDGILTLLGRGSQCINTGGEKVFPEEVEEVLKVHPSVEDALVFGLPDERFGQRIAAVVSLAPDAEAVDDPKAIVDAVRDRISSYKLPAMWSSSTWCRGPPTARPTTRGRGSSSRAPRVPGSRAAAPRGSSPCRRAGGRPRAAPRGQRGVASAEPFSVWTSSVPL